MNNLKCAFNFSRGRVPDNTCFVNLGLRGQCCEWRTGNPYPTNAFTTLELQKSVARRSLTSFKNGRSPDLEVKKCERVGRVALVSLGKSFTASATFCSHFFYSYFYISFHHGYMHLSNADLSTSQ